MGEGWPGSSLTSHWTWILPDEAALFQRENPWTGWHWDALLGLLPAAGEMSPSVLRGESRDHITASATGSNSAERLGLGTQSPGSSLNALPSPPLPPGLLLLGRFTPLSIFQSSSLSPLRAALPQPARKKHFLEYCLSLFVWMVKRPLLWARPNNTCNWKKRT